MTSERPLKVPAKAPPAGLSNRPHTAAGPAPVPDCVVAFDVDPERITETNGYVISEVGKPPEFVLEVASETTGVRDYTVKRDRYAEMRVGEYWRFDHTGGRYHVAALAGDLLVDGGYAPITITGEAASCGSTARWASHTCPGNRS